MSGPAAPAGERSAEIAAAEEWFRDRGLPWFVDPVDQRVRALIGRRRVRLLLVAVVLVAGLAGWGTFRALEDWPSAVLIGVVVALGVLLAYAGGPLRVAVIARWAVRQVVAELDLVLPLVSRALPLLLLFMIFLFINTEVWQVASALPRASLYGVVLLFSVLGVAFLLTRLPEEVRAVQRAAAGEALARSCRGTPLEARARALAAAGDGAVRGPGDAVRDPDGAGAGPGGSGAGPDVAGGSSGDEPLSPTQRANLLLVLLVTQALQVLLLALAVFAFFVAFGLLAIPASVVRSWIGHPPTPISWHWGAVVLHLPVSAELYQVSVFLSAFAGFYFTVYAVTDATYREHFFAELSQGLEQAIGVREVYRLLRRDAPDGTPDAPVPRG